MTVYKCPLEQDTHINVGDIVIGQNGKIYMLITQKRNEASYRQRHGCEACVLHKANSINCTLETNIIFSVKYEKTLLNLSHCFRIISSNILDSNYVSFVELSSGGV